MADLCTACMCTGRNLYYIGDTGFYHIYSQILNEISVYDSSPLFIRVCWECLAHLRKWLRFKEQAKRCYTQLQFVHQNMPQQSETHLTVSELYNFSFPETLIKTELDVPPSPEKLSVKVEEHSEETFVHDLNVEPKRRRKKVEKVEKPIKVKPKKKIKPLPEKIPVKKKVKIKKNRSPSPASPEPLDEPDLQEDDLDVKENVLEGAEKKEECDGKVARVKESTVSGPCAELPERPQCAECGKNFSSRKTYRYHLNVLHKGQNRYPCPRCGKVYQWKSNLGRHLRSHKARDSGELYCETCDKRFASVATYRQHLRVSRRHVPESDFSFMCNECGKKFVNKTRLRDHIDWDHLNKIKFRCQMCNKPFKCHTSLYVHLQNVHRNKEKKDNLCHVCGKSYQNAAKLKYHIVAMHTSETPYQCTQCSAAFGWYSSLYRHVREVHYKMKLQPKKSKKSKKSDMLPPLLPTQVLPPMHPPGP